MYQCPQCAGSYNRGSLLSAVIRAGEGISERGGRVLMNSRDGKGRCEASCVMIGVSWPPFGGDRDADGDTHGPAAVHRNDLILL
jgi:hypothetical protein